MRKADATVGEMRDVRALFPEATAWEEVRLARDSPFSYQCQGCCRCCRHKRIRVNPYEVARLAGNLGVSTTEFLLLHTRNGGIELAVDDEDRCVFLTAKGCGVHPDRPLVCRLYPLARHTLRETGEFFSLLPPHPQTEGLIGKQSTVGDYLANQGAEPFLVITDRYLSFIGSLAGFFLETEKSGWTEKLQALDTRGDEMLPQSALLDMDLALTSIASPPYHIEAMSCADKVELHLRFLEDQLQAVASLRSGNMKQSSGGRHGNTGKNAR